MEKQESGFLDKRCLVIDDFPGMRSMLRDMLRGLGAKQVEQAQTGHEAIALLEKAKYDIVLCDYNLGAGQTGQQALEEAKIRQLVGPACAWIMVSAEKSIESVMGAAEHKPDGYLVKPITTALLQTRLQKIWERKKAFMAIDLALAAANYPQAIALCDQRLAFDKANATELLRLKSELLLASDQAPAARALLQQILAERDLAWAKTDLAKIEIQDGNLEAARGLLSAVIADNSTYLEAYDLLANTLLQQGNLAEAEQVLENGVRLSPNSVLRQKTLGELALKRGDIETAEKAFRKSLAAGAFSVVKTPGAYLGLAKVCAAKHDPQEALKLLDTMQKSFPDPSLVLRAKIVEGMVQHQMGQYGKARQAAEMLRNTLREQPTPPDGDTCIDIAEFLFSTGDKDTPVDLLQNVARNHHDDPYLLSDVQRIFDLGRMHDEGSRLVEAARQEAIAMMDNGVLLARAGQLDEAAEWVRNARKALPNNVRILFNCAHILIEFLQQQHGDEALQAEIRDCLLQAERLAPGQARHKQLQSMLEAATAAGDRLGSRTDSAGPSGGPDG